MNASYDKNTAVVVLPGAGHGRLTDPAIRQWLAQSDIGTIDRPVGSLGRILAEIQRPPQVSGLAALRMWGQTGDRPTSWIAAADPVFLEPQLDRLCLHALDSASVQSAELGPLVDHLQAALGGESGYGFACVDSCAYITSQIPIATASVSAGEIDQRAPDDYLPVGDDVAGHRKLLSEIEMALHDHSVNLRRQEDGRPPINSLWIWGGGHAPEQHTEPHPPLYSDEPMLAGYWRSKTAVVERWPGSIDACLEASVAGFVATLPEHEDGLLENALRQMNAALRTRRLNALVLLFRDGLRAKVLRSHALRIWRRRNNLLEADPEVGCED